VSCDKDCGHEEDSSSSECPGSAKSRHRQSATCQIQVSHCPISIPLQLSDGYYARLAHNTSLAGVVCYCGTSVQFCRQIVTSRRNKLGDTSFEKLLLMLKIYKRTPVTTVDELLWIIITRSDYCTEAIS